MQWHSDKLIRGKTLQLPIIAQVLVTQLVKEDTAVSSAFEMKNQVIKTFLSLLKFSFNVGKV